MGGLNDNWKASKYYQVGSDGAGYLHKALGITPAAIAQLRSQWFPLSIQIKFASKRIDSMLEACKGE